MLPAYGIAYGRHFHIQNCIRNIVCIQNCILTVLLHTDMYTEHSLVYGLVCEYIYIYMHDMYIYINSSFSFAYESAYVICVHIRNCTRNVFPYTDLCTEKLFAYRIIYGMNL